LLTASREGFLAAILALAGSCVLLTAGHPKRLLAGALALPPAAAILWMVIPHGTFERLATIGGQLQQGDLNQRLNIWQAGWHAFVRAPFFGTGAGSFASAAGLAPIDTAHNTALSIAVNGGIVALFLATAILASAISCVVQTRGRIRWALATALLVWIVASLVATTEENRTTWLLLALIALAARLAVEQPEELDSCFSAAYGSKAADPFPVNP
jgi:O-antigen ligase